MSSMDPVPVVKLQSWKEIANHVGRGVRTVQRWERELGMPVRRPRSKSRSAVMALSDEIDAWLRSAPTAKVPSGDYNVVVQSMKELHETVEIHLNLRSRCHELRTKNQEALHALLRNLLEMKQAVESSRAGNSPKTEISRISDQEN